MSNVLNIGLEGRFKFTAVRPDGTERVLLPSIYPSTRILSFAMTEKLCAQIELVEP